MTTTHSKGRWISEALDNPNTNHVIYTSENSIGIANVYPSEEGQANAKLIASAPELLENLARIIDRIEENELQSHFPFAYNRAKEALAKAV